MDERETLIDFYYFRFQSVRRAQKRYFAFLLGYLTFLWFFWSRPSASAQLLGIPISDVTILGVAPWISTVLLLGFVGSLRAVEPAFQRLKEAWRAAGATSELNPGAIDNHDNWVDCMKFIWTKPFSQWIYVAAPLASLASNIAIGLILTPRYKGYQVFLFTSYCLLCLALQATASWKLISERKIVFRSIP